MVFLNYGCNQDKDYTGTKEGVLIYDITYPNEPPSLVLDLYPKELVFYFKGDKMSTELKSSYDLISTKLIIDNQKERLTQLLKNMRERHYVEVKKKQMPDWLSHLPKLTYQMTEETASFLGYECQKVLAYLPDSTIAPLELYITQAMDLPKDNWWNQFSGLEGFLMGYELEAFGKRMCVRAREIHYKAIEEMKFEIPPTFEESNLDDMHQKMAELMAEYAK